MNISPVRSASQQQFWTPDQRTQILNYVNKYAHNAIDEKGLDADVEARGRALVAVLAFTGVRAAEVFHSEHNNCTGHQRIRWRDVDLDEQTISVPGKNQQRQSVWLLEQAIPTVERYRTSVIHQLMIGPFFRRDTRHRCINALGRIFAE